MRKAALCYESKKQQVGVNSIVCFAVQLYLYHSTVSVTTVVLVTTYEIILSILKQSESPLGIVTPSQTANLVDIWPDSRTVKLLHPCRSKNGLSLDRVCQPLVIRICHERINRSLTIRPKNKSVNSIQEASPKTVWWVILDHLSYFLKNVWSHLNEKRLSHIKWLSVTVCIWIRYVPTRTIFRCVSSGALSQSISVSSFLFLFFWELYVIWVSYVKQCFYNV